MTLSGPRLADEAAFFKRYLSNLPTYPQTYDDDFVTPPEKRPRRMPVLSLEIAPPPMEEDEVEGSAQATASSSGSSGTAGMISLTIKSLKPSFSFPIQAHLTDSVAHLKSLIASSSQASTPSVESQRLLLKGKALTDAKLLKEYEEFKDGATVTLVIKPGAAMTATSRMETQQQATAPAPPSLTVTENADGNTGANATTRAPTARAMNDADISVPPLGPGPSSTTAAPANEDLHEKLASISFWRKIHDVCREELGGDHGKEAASVRADEVTLMFLKSVGDRLSAGEIAKVQDALGIDAMGGSRI